MRNFTVPDDIRYAARIRGVLEVALAGQADLGFWRAALAGEGLVPFDAGGRAELLVNATALTWKGLRFRELVFNVSVGAGDDESRLGGFFLIHAFNSSALLALAERRLFKTPYYHGAITTQAEPPAVIELRDRGRFNLSAAMIPARQPESTSDYSVSGPVFLPGAGRPPARFFVALSGSQRRYPFVPDRDRIEIDPASRHPIFRQLADSGFTPNEWRICLDAEHAKSQTYRD
ncbi:MAG TPA: hypothetical protein VD886_09855 [Herpetosiphonaceae bacterium]|nr:hypothetical protein [Herpetosiphonaceae bacterium]